MRRKFTAVCAIVLIAAGAVTLAAFRPFLTGVPEPGAADRAIAVGTAAGAVTLAALMCLAARALARLRRSPNKRA